jgi:hypothetical protein
MSREVRIACESGWTIETTASDRKLRIEERYGAPLFLVNGEW